MHKPSRREGDVIAEEVSGDCVIYDVATKRAHHLNSTLSWIWKHCDGSRSINDLAAAMQQELGHDRVGDMVSSGLKQLADANLLEPGSVDPHLIVAADTSDVSRRAVIAGASIVAPMITSILAPTPAAAKSKPDKIDKNKGQKVNSGKKKN